MVIEVKASAHLGRSEIRSLQRRLPWVQPEVRFVRCCQLDSDEKQSVALVIG